MLKHERRKRRDTRYRVVKVVTRRTSKLSEIDYAAVAYRLEQIFLTLTGDTVGAQSVSVNRGAFNRAIAHCKRLASGQIKETGDDMSDEENATLELLHKYNQSCDWVFVGDPGLMILQRAENTNSTRPELRIV